MSVGLLVYFGDGAGNWTLQMSEQSFGYGGVDVGDINNDGILQFDPDPKRRALTAEP